VAYDRHVKATLSGTFRNASDEPLEIFSYGLSMGRVHGQSGTENPDFTGTKWADIRDLLVEYHTGSDMSLNSRCVLELVKFADVGTDGRYLSPPLEFPIEDGGGDTSATYRYPFQVAAVMSFAQVGVIHPARGRWYVPAPMFAMQTDGRISLENAQQWNDATAILIGAIGQRFFDDDDYTHWWPVVASRKTAVGNAQIVEVKTGRVLDTQRRRRNALAEGYVSSILPDPA